MTQTHIFFSASDTCAQYSPYPWISVRKENIDDDDDEWDVIKLTFIVAFFTSKIKGNTVQYMPYRI